ncbi:MAG: response regulator, partial [Pseudomonadota bacterium]
ITTDDVDQLFEAFETAETEEAAGAGLGLAVSRRLVELMGGTLEAENHPDGGAQCTARVPVPGAQYAESPGTGGDAAGVGGHSLLLIDDNDLVRDSLAAFFRRSGARITVAEGGAAALALVDEGLRPTLVVLDMHMPGMDGVATARALRDRPATRRVPILALSADALPEMTAAAAEAGVTEYYVKPLDRKGLDRIVARYLG